jgi:hypothetical protein
MTYHHNALMIQTSMSSKPTSFKEALTKEDAPLWQLAIDEVLTLLEKNITWESFHCLLKK